MNVAFRATVFSLVCTFASIEARAEPIPVPVTVTTSGTFGCLAFAPCFTGAGTNQVTITSGTGTASITFTGVDATFMLTNTTREVTLGRFDVTATPGFIFPTNLANPELPILAFSFLVALDGRPVTGLFWGFGPGGGTTLPMQQGLFDFGGRPGVDISPYEGIAFQANQPILALNDSTLLTADAGLVPEPGTLLLIGSGLAGGLLTRRRSRRSTE